MNEVQTRIVRYINEYNAAVWPDFAVPVIKPSDLERMEIRADMYSNGHVEGEHEANGLCPYSTSTECGERLVAAEFVESN